MNRLISVLTAFGGLLVFPLVDSAIKGTIVLLLAGAVCLWLRRESAATRHFVLSTAMGLLLAMPILSLALPAWRILPTWMRSKEPVVATVTPKVDSLPPATMTQRDLEVPPVSSERASDEMPETAQGPSVPIPDMRRAEIEDRPATTPRSPISWTTLLSCVWFAGCLLLMSRLVVASVMLRRSERRSLLLRALPGERQGVSPPSTFQMPGGSGSGTRQSSHDPRESKDLWRDPLQSSSQECGQTGTLRAEGQQSELTRRADALPLAEVQRLQHALGQAKTALGVTWPVQLMLDPQRSIPVVWGLWSTRLQLPADALGWSDEQLRSVLLHELAHIRRRDLFVLAMTQVVCALYWFNPLIWLAAWRLHVERERACDDLVLASGVRASSYAEHLLNVATRLSPSRWTQACGLAMARSSSLHRRLKAVLSEKQNRRRMTNLITCVSLMIAGAISVPIAMLQGASLQTDEQVGTNSRQAANSKATTPPTSPKDGSNSQDSVNAPNVPVFALSSDSAISFHEQHLDWSEPVSGLRAAVSIRPTAIDGKFGKERRILLVIQNVSDQPIRFCDNAIQETDTPTADVEGRKLYLQDNGEILFAIQNAKSTKTDCALKPREMLSIDLLDMGNDQAQNRGDSLAEGILKDSGQALFAVLNIVHAPEGAWTGKLRTPATRGAIAAQGPLPKSKEGQILFRYCVDHARLNGDIPGGLISRLHDLVQEFIQLNSGDQYGDAYAKKMRPLLTRFENKGDWKQEDIAKLFDDIAEVSTIPLERTMNAIRENSLQRGLPIPASMDNLNWGEALPGGLRMAWMLEPRAEEYHRSSALKSRVILHNSGDKPVMFVTRSFHQPEHKAATTEGTTVPVTSTFWTTIGRPEPYRLHPGEYCEVHAPGIGIGPENKELEDWSNVRAGTWILADEDEEIVFQPGEILLTGDHNENVDEGWWLKFITERIRRETPLPVDSKEREVILFRVISDLFGNSPTPEEAAGFLADNSPQAVENLANVLSKRTWHTSVAGPISSGEIKFRVLPEDPEAATRPRIATNPGRYNLGEEIRFVVSRRPVGETLVNEADLVWYPPGQDNAPTKVSLPNGYDTWAAGWMPGTTVLWVSQAGLLRSYDFTNNAAVKETRYEGDQITTAPIPEALNAALRAALTAKESVQEQPRRPVGPPAAMKDNSKQNNAAVKEPKHEVSKILMEHWRRFARSDGKIPGACVGSLKTHLEEYSIAFPKLRPLMDRLDAARDWPQSEVTALLDEITDIAPAGMPLQARLNEYILSNPANLQLGQPLPPELGNVVWGQALENGLRAAWLVDPEIRTEFYADSGVTKSFITSRLLIQNSGGVPVTFILPKFTLPERAKVIGGELHEIPFVRGSAFQRLRLDPGHYVEVPVFSMTLQDSEDLSQASTEAVIVAEPGAELQLSYSVDLTTEILQQPDDLKDPDAIWSRTIANRVAEEAPLPVSAADRELMLRHVMADMFGEQPTAAEIATLVDDSSPDALTRLVERLQKRPLIRPVVGELGTGTTSVRVATGDRSTFKASRPEPAAKPKHEATASLITKWQRFARSDGKIPGALLGTVRSKIEHFLKQYPKDNATSALAEVLPSYDVSHDWEPADVIALLDKTADLHTAPLGWADLPLEFGDMRRVKSGSALPESLRNVAWGQPSENGLRVAWVLDPSANSYSLGTVLKSRVLFHNNGLRPIMFLTETWHQDDRHEARDAAGQEIKVGSTWYSGITPMATYRLEPGHYVEIQGHGIGIGAGEYREERSTGAVGAWIEAKVDDEVHFTTTVRFDQQGWTRPDDPTEPAELRKINIAERVALEAPLPASVTDRKQMIIRITNEIFGENPTDAEVTDFLNDESPDALKNLTIRLQEREHLPLFRGTLATGETIFRVLPVDPEAATRPRRAIGPGRYVLSDSVHLAVQQVTSVERFGAPEVRTNTAKILFLSPDPKVASPHKPYEIQLPDGLANYAILWARNSGQLFVVEPGSVRTIDFTNPADVKESRSKLNLAPEYRALIPESLQSVLE
ncbi:MAG: M56 family metallopeptidase [Planctomycetaceae bacterium]